MIREEIAIGRRRERVAPMKTLAPLVLSLATLIGCTASTSDAGPTSCDPTQRVGTYRFTYTEQSGTCGRLDPQVVSLNPGPNGAGSGCRINSERLSEGACKLERDVTCNLDSGTVRTVAVSRDESGDGSVLSGIATIVISGTYACSGTYRLTATRL